MENNVYMANVQQQQAQTQQFQQPQQVTDPAYAQYLEAQRQAILRQQAEMQAMQNRIADKVYNDPKTQQVNPNEQAQQTQQVQQAQQTINGATLDSIGESSEDNFVISMDDIMGARFNESTNVIHINFKKTCLIKAYETEVVEGSASIELNESMSGIERALAINIIEAQVEQAVNENVLSKGLVTHYEYEQKKKALVETVNRLREQAIEIVGEEQVNKIFNFDY